MSETSTPAADDVRFLARAQLQELLDALGASGFQVVGPTPRDGAIVYDQVRSVAELPIGLREQQAPGRYRLEPAGHERVFDVVNGPSSLKPFFFAPREELLQIDTGANGGFEVHELEARPARTAFLGVRPCDLAALRVQDRVFLGDRFPDPWYAARRADVLLVAVSCVRPAATCFCTSLDTGPEAADGYDLALTELSDGFSVRAGSGAGRELLERLGTTPLHDAQRAAEREALDACAAAITRRLDTHDLPDMLYESLSHPRWDEVAERCLSCANCTLVCPTCFCHDELDEPALAGDGSVRVRIWSSCFDRDHAQVHGANYRPGIAHRYRQWLVHKLGSWIDQFGSSGCVGCGRCISWCPVGIDLTEEVAALRGEVPA